MSVLKYYDDIAADYDQSRFRNSYGLFIDCAERAILTTWLRGVEQSNIIDFGCGTGRFLDFAGTGIDGSHKMLEIAAAKYPKHRLIHADLTDLPENLSGYEVGICFHVSMHLEVEQIRQLLGQAAKAIRPGGRLIIDFLAAPRRRILRHQKSGWHGNTDFALLDVLKLAAPHWHVRRRKGLLLLPIHRFPKIMRFGLTKLDAFLCNSIFFPLSSYYVIELENQR